MHKKNAIETTTNRRMIHNEAYHDDLGTALTRAFPGATYNRETKYVDFSTSEEFMRLRNDGEERE